MPFGFGRKNSEKTLNNNTVAAVPAATTAPLQGRTYDLPAEPVAAAVLPGKTYELPMESPIQQGSASMYSAPIENRRLSQTIIEPALVGDRRLSQTYETTGISSGSYSNVAGNRLSVTRAEPTIIERIEKDVVIQERIHPVEKEEIQPIIYREREQLDVRQVTQMMHETQIQPTLIEQRELPAERREAIIERGAPIAENIVLPSVERDATLRTQQVHAPIVEETIKKTVIEEIQPVLERDVFVPTVVQQTQPIYEKIVEAPTVYREVRTVQELGTREVIAPVVAAPIVEPVIVKRPPSLSVVPITTTTVVETYDHKLNPIETRDFVNNRGLPLR